MAAIKMKRNFPKTKIQYDSVLIPLYFPAVNLLWWVTSCSFQQKLPLLWCYFNVI